MKIAYFLSLLKTLFVPKSTLINQFYVVQRNNAHEYIAIASASLKNKLLIKIYMAFT